MESELQSNEEASTERPVHVGEEERKGASADVVDELPMVVWIKGDEPFAGEFSLDAEAAMDKLGIKRSRLTQISGKELRVGRVRVDRYVRPMYRPIDIERYKTWSRAPATHVRSASLVNEAAQVMRERTKDLAKQLEHSLEQQQDMFDKAVEDSGRIMYEAQKGTVQQIESTRSLLIDKLADQAKHTQQMAMRIESQLSELKSDAKVQVENMGKHVLVEVEALANMVGELSESSQSLKLALQPLEDIRESLLNEITQSRRAAEETYQLLFDSAGQSKHNQESMARYNRAIAETLTKIIECQRDLANKQNLVLQRTRAQRLNDEHIQRFHRRPRRRFFSSMS